MAGYSGTPLIKKLDLRAGHCLLILGMTDLFLETLGPLTEGLQLGSTDHAPLDRIILFVYTCDQLCRWLVEVLLRLVADGSVWVAWPKKASKVPTDLTEASVRLYGLSVGLVDNKVCAIDEIWSGLRFVVRLKDREEWSQRHSG